MKTTFKYYFKKPLNWFRIAKLLINEFFILIDHLGSSNYETGKEKYKAKLIINAHVIEKGLSLKNVKIGFGEPRVIQLLNDLDFYYTKYRDTEILSFVISIINEYIIFNKANNTENRIVINKFNDLKKHINDDKFVYTHGGAKDVTKEEILKNASINYSDFVKSRYSIRNFTGETIKKELVYNALEIASYTPSACNRQPWGNYVFFNKEKIIKLLDYQTGARQFKNDITCLILITSNYNSFFGGEYHQPFVNGGLYAMNLMLALHANGLGTTPLNMGFGYSKLKELKKHCEIKNNEVPIMMIGVGVIPEKLKVAISKRFDFRAYTKIY